MQTHPSVFFDEEHARQYDERFTHMAPIRELLHFLTNAALSDLPEQARILIVGAGTGLELSDLAQKHPRWSFVAVEPSEAMFRQLKARCEKAGIAERCTLFHGFLSELKDPTPFDGATSLLVSHFILDKVERRDYFQEIALRLCPEAPLINADLSADLSTPEGEALLERWFETMSHASVDQAQREKMRAALENDVAVSAPHEVESLIASAGFGTPLQVAQTLLIRVWVTIRIGT